MCGHVDGLAGIDPEAAQQCRYHIKYEGYITRQKMEVKRQHHFAEKRIPELFHYQRRRETKRARR